MEDLWDPNYQKGYKIFKTNDVKNIMSNKTVKRRRSDNLFYTNKSEKNHHESSICSVERKVSQYKNTNCHSKSVLKYVFVCKKVQQM